MQSYRYKHTKRNDMKQIEQRHIDFVVKYYQEGKLDTQQAIAHFHHLTHTPAKRLHISKRIMTIAATFTLLIALSLTLLYVRDTQGKEITATATNMPLTCQLKDGSKIILSPHSTLTYSEDELKEGKRQLSLQGKAYFQIHHDELHPCIIHTQRGNVKVLGTVFQVDVKPQATEVYVESGKVCFYNSKPNLGLILTKGKGGKLTPNSEQPSPYEASANSTSWATGIFHFNHTPVQEALREMSEYCDASLSAEAKDKYLSGDIEIQNAEDAKDMLESILGIQINIEKNHTR